MFFESNEIWLQKPSFLKKTKRTFFEPTLLVSRKEKEET